MSEIKWEKWAAMVITLGAGALGVYLAFRYLFPILLPFFIALGVALLIRPAAARFSARTRLPQKFCAAVFFLLFLSLLSLSLGVAVHRLLLELGELLERSLAEGGDFSEMIRGSMDLFDTLTSRIGFLRRIGAGERFEALRATFNELAANMLGGLLNGLTAEIPALLGNLIAALPTIFLAIVVTVIAGLYFCMDGEGIGRRIVGYLPQGLRTRLPVWRCRVKRVSFRYLRAYLLLLLLTFLELFAGFLILRVDYALLLALTLALIDLLPILGVGTALVPWAVVSLLQNNYYLGFGLLILYGAITVLRQIFEPRLVGKSLGLSPLLTLFVTWAGWQLLGFWGMLLAPFAALLGKALLGQVRR